MRPESATYLQHVAVELNEENQRAVYVPERFAHGYQVLRDGTEVTYQMSEFYSPDSEVSCLYNDPRLGLTWPMEVTVISDTDKRFPPLDQFESELRRKMGIVRKQ